MRRSNRAAAVEATARTRAQQQQYLEEEEDLVSDSDQKGLERYVMLANNDAMMVKPVLSICSLT
jgi:hypothetical protein